MRKHAFAMWLSMMPIVRQTHIKIVKAYIPYDHETELAEALFNWKYRK